MDTNQHNPVEIRPAGPDDWQTYRDLRLEMLATAPEAFGTAPEELENRSDSEWRSELTEMLAQKDRRTFIAWHLGTAAVGMAGIYPHAEHGMLVGRIYVKPEHRQHHIGHQLLAAAEKFARDQDSPTVSLWVTANNPVAREWYLRAGYSPLDLPILKTTEQGPAHHDELLVKRLDASATDRPT